MLEPIWVAKLIISQKTGAKLASLHRLEVEDVRLAIQCVAGLRCTWKHHPERGWRALVEVDVRRRGLLKRRIRVLVILYPVDDPVGDAYALGSAYPRR